MNEKSNFLFLNLVYIELIKKNNIIFEIIRNNMLYYICKIKIKYIIKKIQLRNVS